MFLVLDILSKPVFCAWHLHSIRNVPYEVFALSSGKLSTAAGIAASEVHDKPYSNETGGMDRYTDRAGRSMGSNSDAVPVYMSSAS